MTVLMESKVQVTGASGVYGFGVNPLDFGVNPLKNAEKEVVESPRLIPCCQAFISVILLRRQAVRACIMLPYAHAKVI